MFNQGRLHQLSQQLRANFSSEQTEPIIIYNQITPFLQKVTLNKPKQLNALSLDMIRSLKSQISSWNNNQDLKVLLFTGKGKGFSAGGDIKSLYEYKQSTNKEDHKKLAQFFSEEYYTDYQIANLRPYQVCLWDGIVMGGGVGISMYSKFRVATENSMFAMPEAKIGLFTDVGASFFLSRLKDNLGLYLGLTGARVKGQDLVTLGLANFYINSSDAAKLEQLFVEKVNKNTSQADIQNIINEVSQKNLQAPNFNLVAIKELFQADTFEQLLKNLESDQKHTQFSQGVLKILKESCPMSLRVIFEQIKRGQTLTLKEAFEMEQRLVNRFMEENDFFEGVRCTLIDKNDKPKWKHSSPLDISQAEVERYFQKLPNDLELKL